MRLCLSSILFIGCTLLPSAIFGAPASSASYSVTAYAANAGGGQASSGSYSITVNVGDIGAVSTTGQALALKSGYAGQLYDSKGLLVTASSVTVDEGGTRQLTASQILDDSSQLRLSPTAVIWKALDGPLTGVSTDGVATAGTVYQHTAATVQAVQDSFQATLTLTIVDVATDNYGLYAGDGLPDDWQVKYFGLDNPQAAPSSDPDGDGEDNAFEFTAGVDPADATSRFALRIEAVPGQASHRALVFKPYLPDRTYVIETRSSLSSGNWLPLNGGAVSDNGTQRTVTDSNAGGLSKFYRVRITKP